MAIGACAILAVLAVAQHPVAASHVAAQAIPEVVQLSLIDRLVHGFLIATTLATFFGFTIFSARRGFDRHTTIAGFIGYALGVAAVIGAALIDGFIIPDIAARYVKVTHDDIRAAVPLLTFCAIAIQNLTKLGFVAMSAGIFAWSVGLVASPGTLRTVGIVGFFAAGLPVVILSYAHFLNPHLLGIIVLVQAVWYLAIAALLWKRLV